LSRAVDAVGAMRAHERDRAHFQPVERAELERQHGALSVG
jgi:hypothetical protein